MSRALIIAIDGPVASGKSTLAEKLAAEMGYLYFDTGAMYRAVTLAALQRGVSTDDEQAMTALAEQVQIDMRAASQTDGRQYDVLLDGVDCTWSLRTPEVEANVSRVSAYPGVRAALTEQQRRIGLRGGVVMAGRDIGTVVLPEAQLKIFLEASPEVRAKRRFDEQRARGEAADYEEVLASLKERDEYDTNRAVAPLRPAEDAHRLNTNNLEPDDVLREVTQLAMRRQAELSS
jgi:cytidylate kinase